MLSDARKANRVDTYWWIVQICRISGKEHFTAASLEDLSQNVDSRKIIDFTKETHFYTQL